MEEAAVRSGVDRQTFQGWARSDDLKAMLAYLMGGVHHGRPGRPTSVKRQALLALRAEGDAPRRFAWAQTLASQESYVARELACGLVDAGWPQRRSEVEATMLRLADDGDWEVRECAASLLHRIMELDFESALSLYAQWSQHRSANVRRAIVLAAKYTAAKRRPQQAEPLLDLLERHLPDTSEYVRKNLGPFAIGDGLLCAFPQATLARLRLWTVRPEEGTRWNVAMVFTSAEGARHLETALPILSELAVDERRFVWRAVSSALRCLGKRHAPTIRELLQSWLDDSRRVHVAQTALRYLENRRSSRRVTSVN